jgi:DNA processing protein
MPSEMVSPQTMQLLTALQLPGVGAAAVRKLANAMRDQDEVTWFYSPTQHERSNQDLVTRFQFRTQNERPIEDLTQWMPAAASKARKILEACASRSIFVISILDPEYPRRLRSIKDAPPVLYIRGSVAALNKSGCAVVGTRKATETGLKIARRIASVLAEHGLSTVSGLALGIDAAAHSGAVEKHGVTIAILAHGLDMVAPTSNKKLAEQLLECGGALVSEHEPGVPPRPAEFVRRNRIQSGMSLCSIIVESGKEGGSIHQARFTKEQGRPILAVLPDLEKCTSKEFNYEGGKYLVATMGARPLRTAEDLEEQIDMFMKNESHNSSSEQFRLL